MTSHSHVLIRTAFFAVVPLTPILAQKPLNWRQQPPPPASSYHAMTSDATGQGVVVFTTNGHTWTLNGGVWRDRTTSYGPSARTGATMVLDPFRQRALLFGGRSVASGNFLQDTWEWDGKGWIELQPATVPGHRAYFGMAYDYQLRRIVMFGGSSGRSYYGDTFEWDGTNGNWIAKGTGGPTPRMHPAMASNHQGGIVLFGGYNGYNRNDTWVRSNGTWQYRTPNIVPPADHHHKLEALVSQRQALMTGGVKQGQTAWLWDGRDWARTAAAPAAEMELGYDFATKKVIAFGGILNRESVDTTACFDGSKWDVLPIAPTARQYAAAGYDPVAREVVLHGGYGPNTSTRFTDTWTWNGTRWEQTTASAPFLSSHSVDWDPVAKRLVMFGGWDGTRATAETRSWNASLDRWDMVSTTSKPPARWGHTTVSLTGARPGILVFGGHASTYFRDLWHFDGTNWNQLQTTGSPSPRAWADMVLEPGGKTVMLFGGYDSTQYFRDTWRLDLQARTWTQLSPSQPPPPRGSAAMVFEPGRQLGVLLGGSNGTSALQDAWAWDSATSQWMPYARPPFGLFGHITVNGPDQTVFVFGGINTANRISKRTWSLAPHLTAIAQPIGSGCMPSQGNAPTLSCPGLPYIGDRMELRLSRLPASATRAFFMLNVSRRSSPLSICSGCAFYIDPLIMFAVPALFGTADAQFNLASDPSLVGLSAYAQGAVSDPAFPCITLGLSNALELRVGTH